MEVKIEQLNLENIATLKKDIVYLLQLTKHIDHKYAKGDRETYHYLRKLRKIVDRFNEKYHGVNVAVKKENYRIFLKFFIRKDSVKETFQDFMSNNVINKDIGDSIKLDNEYANVSEKTYPGTVFDTLVLRKDLNRDMVELIYRDDTLHNTNSPEFRILAMHALDTLYNSTVEIKEPQDDVFCFDFDTEGNSTGLVYRRKKIEGQAEY